MVANFKKSLISPNFISNFRKSHQISKNYIKSCKRYGQKPLEGVPKDLNRVKGVFGLNSCNSRLIGPGEYTFLERSLHCQLLQLELKFLAMYWLQPKMHLLSNLLKDSLQIRFRPSLLDNFSCRFAFLNRAQKRYRV